MEVESILTPLYAILAVLGFILLCITDDDIINMVIGFGAVILGVLGLEARGISDTLKESRGAE